MKKMLWTWKLLMSEWDYPETAESWPQKLFLQFFFWTQKFIKIILDKFQSKSNLFQFKRSFLLFFWKLFFDKISFVLKFLVFLFKKNFEEVKLSLLHFQGSNPQLKVSKELVETFKTSISLPNYNKKLSLSSMPTLESNLAK